VFGLVFSQSLIDLAGSEKATSDKARSAEGKYINTSLLALKQVIATIAKNETKKEHAHVVSLISQPLSHLPRLD
jgi:hypothetical protein